MKQGVSMLKLSLPNPLSMGCLVEQILKLPVHAVHTPRSLQASFPFSFSYFLIVNSLQYRCQHCSTEGWARLRPGTGSQADMFAHFLRG